MGNITSVCCEQEKQRKDKIILPIKNILETPKKKSKQLLQTKSSESKQNGRSQQIQCYSVEDALTDTISLKYTQDGKLRFVFSDFLVLGELGSGAFGNVYLVQLKTEHQNGMYQNYAMKRINKKHLLNQKLQAYTKLQKYILSNLQSPFITSLKYAFKDCNYVYLIMECAMGGSVHTLFPLKNSYIVRKNPRADAFRKLGQKGIQFISACVILALQKLHQNQIMYRDLKPQNVIIFEDGYVKLTDFGLARRVQNQSDLSNTEAGTLLYYAPEIIFRIGYTKYVDFWTLGVFLFELATFQTPFKPQDIKVKQRMKSLVLEAQVKRDWKSQWKVGEQLKDLINKLLKFNPEERLGVKGWQDIKNHAFYKNFDWIKLKEKTLQSPLLSLIQSYPHKIGSTKDLSSKYFTPAPQIHKNEEEWDYDHRKSG